MSKPRDPFATSLTKPQYRQQRVPDKRHRKAKRRDRVNEAREEGGVLC